MLRKPNSECQIMVFRPTMEEFSDFSRYIQYMESQGAHRGGVAKIIPPKEWTPCKSYDNIDNLMIPAPISQVVTGQKGTYTQYNIQQKPLTVKELRRLTNTDKHAPPFHENYEDLERTYWKNITFNPPIYGADISGSLYDKDVDVWNISRLDTILDLVNDTGVKIEGVNTAYLYFGMWKTSFAWHTEDMDLYSINYVHFGAPKTWYAIPPEHGKRLERLARGFFPNSYSTCPSFLRHKMTLISPSVLKLYGIPFNKITQEPGEFMITFPYGYHSGFNHGFNCAESTNFASERWINYGIAAEKCKCRKDMVFINMDLFVKTFQIEKYEDWKANKCEGKLSYTDIPSVPDFTKKPIHWREKVKEIPQVTPVKVPRSPVKKTPQKSTSKSPAKPKPFPGTSPKKESEKQLTDPMKMSYVKLEKNAVMQSMMSTTSPVKKAPIKRALSDSSANVSSPSVTWGSSGSFIASSSNNASPNVKTEFPKCSHQHQSEIINVTDLPTLSDRIKMGRRKICFDSSMSQKSIADTIQSVIEAGIAMVTPKNTALPLNSDHDMYTKRIKKRKNAKTIEKSLPRKSYPPLPVKMHRKSIEMFSPSGTFEFEVNHSGFASAEKPMSQKGTQTIKTTDASQTLATTSTTSTQTTPENQRQRIESSSTDNDFSGPEESMSKYILSRNNEHSPSTSFTQVANDAKSSSVLKSQLLAIRPPLKRRHLVSKKGPSKKSSPAVVLKSGSADSDETDEDDSSAGKIITKRPRGRPKSKPEHFMTNEGYPTLWPRRKISFKAERQYNATVAKLEPRCAVCTLFCPYYQKKSNDEKPPPLQDLLEKSTPLPLGTRTRPVISEINFATSIDNPAPLATCDLLDGEGKSVLIQCSVCMVQVHASCYGIVKPEPVWTCDRCSFKAWIAQCSLCCMRGGALKPVNDGMQWAHILCAVAVPEVSFDDIPLRNGINIRKLSTARQKLKCTYCRRNKAHNSHALGTCIQCCAGSCAVSFHPTCAHAAGIKMETGDWPLPVFVYCHRHALQKEKALELKVDKPFQDVSIGQTVYGKHKNGRFYPCVVRSETSQNFYHVIFSDNSWSDNLYQDDIVSHDFETRIPKEGDAILVNWTDGKKYDATFVSCKKHQVMTVEFEDGSLLSIKREDMYMSMDDMPKRIRRKLSNATLMSRADYLESPKKNSADSFVSQRAAFNEQRKKKSFRKQKATPENAEIKTEKKDDHTVS